jgi:carboxyl-terminal processing protease
MFITVLLVALAFTAGWLGNSAVNRNTLGSASSQPYEGDIWTAWNLIDSQYWNPSDINHQTMAYDAISAMVNSLGDTGHSVALTPANAAQETSSLDNASFVGVGIYAVQLTVNGQTYVAVEATIPGSPANAAGKLLPGDRFLMVKGTSVVNASLDTFDTLIRGPANSTVTVQIQRPGVAAPLTLTITRQSITPQIVYGAYFAEDHIGFVHFDIFATGAAQQMGQVLKSLEAQGATSIILDLRGNGGGLVSEAIGVASDYLQPGQTVFNAKDRSGHITANKVDSDSSVPKGLHLNLPLTILVDNNTASAAEITTLAIKGNRPNVEIIGEQTYGTDSVLQSFQLPSGAQLSLGVAQWLSPTLLHLSPGKGLTPDAQVALPASALPQIPLIITELNLTEADILNCQGLNPDPQLVAGIIDLAPARTSTCTK